MIFFGDGNTFRLRHAYGSYNDYLVGQTWSVFGDPLSLPWTVDFEGPNSSVLERAVQICYSTTLMGKYRFTASLEEPSIELVGPDSVENAFQSIPDVVSRFRWNHNRGGHTQIAGVFRNINTKTSQGNANTLFAYGFLFSGKSNFTRRTHLLYQLVAGNGIARDITSLTGRGLDVVYNPIKDSFETLPVYGGYISFILLLFINRRMTVNANNTSLLIPIPIRILLVRFIVAT